MFPLSLTVRPPLGVQSSFFSASPAVPTPAWNLALQPREHHL
jgi:hypothetical protein